MNADLVTVVLNQKLVVDRAPLRNYWNKKKDKSNPRPIIEEGPIQLQTHGGKYAGKICI